RVHDALALVNLAHRAGHHPTHLSGGEQQRLAIARALVIRPAIILADEPTGNLDRNAGRQLMDLIDDINERTGVTVLLVTHDPVFPRNPLPVCGSSTGGRARTLRPSASGAARRAPPAPSPPGSRRFVRGAL